MGSHIFLFKMFTHICLVSILLPFAFGSILKYPLHASCKLDWEFSASCEDVHAKILSQIDAWDVEICPMTSLGCKNLPCGQQCLYKLVSSDDLSFEMTPNGSGCSVHAESTSETFFAFLDFGTNYCNLRNLIDGQGLSADPGFTEETNNDICTQYTTADCTRY